MGEELQNGWEYEERGRKLVKMKGRKWEVGSLKACIGKESEGKRAEKMEVKRR